MDWSLRPKRAADPPPTENRSYNSEKLTWHEEKWSPASGTGSGAGAAPAEQPVLDLYTELWKTIRESAPQRITPEIVRRRVAVLEACYRQRGVPFPAGALAY